MGVGEEVVVGETWTPVDYDEGDFGGFEGAEDAVVGL